MSKSKSPPKPKPIATRIVEQMRGNQATVSKYTKLMLLCHERDVTYRCASKLLADGRKLDAAIVQMYREIIAEQEKVSTEAQVEAS